MYATAQDLIDRYGEAEMLQVADRSYPPAGAVNTAIVNRAIADASGEIDSYLAAQYLTPVVITPLIVAIPAAIVSACCVIARYRLHDDHTTDRIQHDFDAALRWLRDVSTGRAIIPELVPPTESTGIAVRAPCPVFTHDVLEAML
jgi:phage gp36-like protein